jgi:ATP-dependent helicase/nuclease subunit A
MLAYAELRLLFSERGTADHAEISQAAHRALGEPEAPADLALALEYRLRHILVDEFQDTSQTQFALLQKLTAGWQPEDGHSLFAVGDPMQSIYRFRQAEVGLFLQARDQGLGDHLPLEPLVLTTNFRSAAQIVDWVNAGFRRLFPAKDDRGRGAIRYAPSDAFRAAAPGSGVTVHAVDAAQPNGEAILTCTLVSSALAAGHESIAVLARSRTHLHDIAAALEAAGTRYQAVEVQRLGERIAVRELRALTRALLLPLDRVAWLAVLRAPWCGLTLADLTALAGDDARRPVLALITDADRMRSLSPEGAERVGHVAQLLEQAVRDRRRQDLRIAVESVWLALGGPACLARAGDLAAAQAFLDLLSALEDAADLPLLARLDDALAELYAPPDPDGDPRVQLMTIHKAKGLEFDTVILPGLARLPRGDEQELLQWLEWEGEDGRAHFVLAPIAASDSAREPLEQLLRRREQEKQELESVRLLYVAATRARRNLHLVASLAPAEALHDTRPRRGTLLHHLWPVVAGDVLAALADAPAETQRPATQTAATYPRLIRAARPWEMPPLAAAVASTSGRTEEPVRPDYLWAGSSARHVGTVIHRYLERFATEGLDAWNKERVHELHTAIGRALNALGVDPNEADQATGKVLLGLTNALEDQRGRWVLTAHRDARSEYAVTALCDGRPLNLVIDRTFVDADGVRWIVDFKTGSHEGAGVARFLDEEQARHGGQLERYAEVMARFEPHRPIRLGLYFPLLRGWREWPAATGR